MKKFLLATSFVVMSAGVSLAADLEPVPVVYDWSGFYMGLNGGYGFSGDDRVGVNGVEVGDLNVQGWLGGAQAGYNYQFDSFVMGLETDIQFSDIDDSDSDGVFDSSSQIDYFGTIRARAGFAADNALIYATGGFAYGGIDYSVESAALSMTDDYCAWGWTAGGGVEFAFGDWLYDGGVDTSSWTMKLEYLYVNLNHEDIDNDGLIAASTKATPDFHMVRLGLNFKF